MSSGEGPDAPPTEEREPPPQQQRSHKQFQQQQAKVSEVTEIMRTNIDKMLQRDVNIADLGGRAEVLEEEASEFGKKADRLKRKFWWKNCKMLAILIGIGLVIIVVIVVWAVSKKE